MKMHLIKVHQIDEPSDESKESDWNFNGLLDFKLLYHSNRKQNITEKNYSENKQYFNVFIERKNF